MKKLIFVLIPVLVMAFSQKSEASYLAGQKSQAQQDSVNSELNRAQTLVMQGKAEEATKICTRIMESDPDNKDAVRLWLMANMPRTPTGEQEAIKMMEQLQMTYPKNIAIVFWKSFLQAEHGQNEEALAGFDQLTKLQPDTAVNWIGKGQVLDAMQRYEEAFKAFDRATTLDPKRFDVWGMKGVTLSRLGRYDEAITSMNKGLEIAPNSPVNLYNRACIYSLKGDKAKALADLKQAISVYPGFKESATKDEDFKSLWNDEEFKKLTM